MRKFLSAIALFSLSVLPVWGAELEARYNDLQGTPVVVILTDTPCVLPALTQYLLDDAIPHFHAGTTQYKGSMYQNCWRMSEGVVYIIDTGATGKPDLYAVSILDFAPKGPRI